jgi:spore maturation protein CgeB
MEVSFYGHNYGFTPALKSRHRGLVYGRPYRLVISATSVAICIVRRANSDGHVMRTFEIPACGAFQLAERTDEHESMFEEDREAAFFASPEELLDKAKFYARHDAVRRTIAERGYSRVTSSSNTYADRVAELLRNIG